MGNDMFDGEGQVCARSTDGETWADRSLEVQMKALETALATKNRERGTQALRVLEGAVGPGANTYLSAHVLSAARKLIAQGRQAFPQKAPPTSVRDFRAAVPCTC
jgi:hypothetical protein